MNAEKVILSFVAVIAGLIVATLAFYLYQGTKVINPKTTAIAQISAAPTELPIKESNLFLTIDQPSNESVITTKALTVAGKTTPNTTVIVTSANNDQVFMSNSTGGFSTTINIDSGENKIIITAIASSGEEKQEIITVTSSTEQF